MIPINGIFSINVETIYLIISSSFLFRIKLKSFRLSWHQCLASCNSHPMHLQWIIVSLWRSFDCQWQSQPLTGFRLPTEAPGIHGKNDACVHFSVILSHWYQPGCLPFPLHTIPKQQLKETQHPSVAFAKHSQTKTMVIHQLHHVLSGNLSLQSTTGNSYHHDYDYY